MRLLSLLLLPLVALLGYAPPALATTPPVHIAGTVTNTDGVPQAGGVYVQRVGATSASGVSYRDGVIDWSWSPDNNPEGDYQIWITSTTMDGLDRWWVAGDPAGTTDRSQATVVHLGPGAVVPSIDFVLPAIAKAAGTVVDTSGGGVAGADVTVNLGGNVRSVKTGPTGAYDLGYTRAGTWPIAVSSGPSYLIARTTLTVPASGSVQVPPVTLVRASSISGQVTDAASGLPVPFALVVAYNASTHAQIGAQAVTDAQGHYRIGGLDSTPFVLRFNDGADQNGYVWTLNDGGDPNDWTPQTPITLAEGENAVHDQTLTLKPAAIPPAHTMGGTVTDQAGHPLAAISVTSGDLETQTDRRGRWYLDTPAGSHPVAFGPSWHWDAMVANGPTWFGITATATAGGADLSTVLRPAGRISGVVLAASELDVSEHELWLYDAAGNLLAHQREDSNSYGVDVPAGEPVYLLARGRTIDPVTELMSRWYGDSDARRDATPLQVAAGQTLTGKDLTLAAGLGNLTVPVVSGTRAVGRTLTATTGTWSTMTQTRFATTWWRGSAQVGSGPSYVVKPADAGSALRARVVATNGGTTAPAALSLPAPIAKVLPGVVVRGTSPRAGRVRLAVTVRAPGLVPNGTLVMKRGSRVVKRLHLTGASTVVTLTRQPRGVQRYQVSWSGSAQLAPRAAPVVRVRVR